MHIKQESIMSSVELKMLNELSPYSFEIPAYQRGYRWTSQEVEDLLNDIDEFSPKEIENSSEKRGIACNQ